MAETIETISGTIKQSIARVELFTDAAMPQASWSITYHFEDGMYDAADKLQGSPNFGTRRVTRSFGNVAKTSITAAGVTATVEQIAALVKAAGYQFRKEDLTIPSTATPTAAPAV